MTDDDVERPLSPTVHLTAWLMVLLFVVIVAGSYFARTEIVARGQGKVIPLGRVQLVQPQVRGKITEIRVGEGQSVKKGDVLISLDPTDATSDINRLDASNKRQQLEADIARAIIAPLASNDPATDAFVETGRRVFTGAQHDADDRASEALVVSVLTALRDEVRQIDAEALRIERSKEAQQARLAKARGDSEILAQKFRSTEALQKQGTISQFDYLERTREIKAIENEVLIAERQLEVYTAESDASAKQRAHVISAALVTYRRQLNEAEIALQSLAADLRAAEKRLQDTVLLAPGGGHVENLSVYTVGGYVNAGATLMSIVPANTDLEIEAFFDNRDIGFLQPGQKAFIKFDAFPAERFGVVGGKVSGVGSDAREDTATKKWVYAVRLIPDQAGVTADGRQIRFSSGMTATIDVITGRRRLISYFFEPVLKALQDSFGER